MGPHKDKGGDIKHRKSSHSSGDKKITNGPDSQTSASAMPTQNGFSASPVPHATVIQKEPDRFILLLIVLLSFTLGVMVGVVFMQFRIENQRSMHLEERSHVKKYSSQLNQQCVGEECGYLHKEKQILKKNEKVLNSKKYEDELVEKRAEEPVLKPRAVAEGKEEDPLLNVEVPVAQSELKKQEAHHERVKEGKEEVHHEEVKKVNVKEDDIVNESNDTIEDEEQINEDTNKENIEETKPENDKINPKETETKKSQKKVVKRIKVPVKETIGKEEVNSESQKPITLNDNQEQVGKLPIQILKEGEEKEAPIKLKYAPEDPKDKIKHQKGEKESEFMTKAKEFKATIQDFIKPKKIFQDGRRLAPIHLIHMKKDVKSDVEVYLFDDFFSKKECDGLKDAHDRVVKQFSLNDPIVCFDSAKTLRQHLKDLGQNHIKITPNDFTTGTMCLNETFSSQFRAWFKSQWSFSTAFYPGESQFSKYLDWLMAKTTGLQKEHGGKFQITSYPLGTGYKNHTDCTLNGEDKRDRFATILVYLTDVEEGGKTEFPELGIWVKPKKGRALLWTNMNAKGECEPTSKHFAETVTKGHKYILQRWYYYKNFYTIGKRPPEPQLPARKENVARVNCDEYENGSCRWYDEWNYDHILEYRQKKLTLV